MTRSSKGKAAEERELRALFRSVAPLKARFLIRQKDLFGSPDAIVLRNNVFREAQKRKIANQHALDRVLRGREIPAQDRVAEILREIAD